MISFIVGRGMGHQGRCLSIAPELLQLKRKANIYSFKETHSYLKDNLKGFKRIFPYESNGFKSNNWIRKYGGMFNRSDVIIHDWRPEIIEYRKKKLISANSILASLYHSEFNKQARDSKEMKVFKKHIVSIASQTDVFFHMNLLPPKKIPKINTLYIPVPLITRKVSNSIKNVKQKVGLMQSEKFILVHMGSGLGKHRYQHIEKWYDAVNKIKMNYRIVVAGQLQGEGYHFHKGIIQAPIFANGKDLVNAAELVITKPGMGILSDCISLKKPILMLPADNMERQQKITMLSEIMGSDLAVVSNPSNLQEKIREVLRKKKKFQQKFSRIPTNGAEIVAKILNKMEKCPKKNLLDQYPQLLKMTPYGRK